eukprot:COSAG06_NODE_2667_length_6473_cov_2.348917_3_plen_217_part_00
MSRAAGRVTVADLRAEARRRLKECGGGKTISRMNKRELLAFLDCIEDRQMADAYRRQEEVRDMASPAGLFAEPRRRKRSKKRSEVVDDDITVNRRQRGSGHCMTGRGAMDYRTFVRSELPRMMAQGHSSQAAMRAVGAAWRRYKQGGAGLEEAGGGLTMAGAQEGQGAARNISRAANAAAMGLAAAPLALGPEAALVTEPAAAVAKGVGYISSLFD